VSLDTGMASAPDALPHLSHGDRLTESAANERAENATASLDTEPTGDTAH